MRLIIPKIPLNKLSNIEIKVFRNLDSQNYGKQLSNKITEKLIKPGSMGIYFSHRDYCGIGIFFEKEKFVLGTVYDGYGIGSMIAEFDSKFEFIEWLSNENDQSMSLYGEQFNNQTITKLRLNWYLKDNYSPVWNSYCQYVSEISNTL